MRKVEVIKWNDLWEVERVQNLINQIIEGTEKAGGVVVATNLAAAPSESLVEYCYIIEFDFPNKEKAQTRKFFPSENKVEYGKSWQNEMGVKSYVSKMHGKLDMFS